MIGHYWPPRSLRLRPEICQTLVTLSMRVLEHPESRRARCALRSALVVESHGAHATRKEVNSAVVPAGACKVLAFLSDSFYAREACCFKAFSASSSSYSFSLEGYGVVENSPESTPVWSQNKRNKRIWLEQRRALFQPQALNIAISTARMDLRSPRGFAPAGGTH